MSGARTGTVTQDVAAAGTAAHDACTAGVAARALDPAAKGAGTEHLFGAGAGCTAVDDAGVSITGITTSGTLDRNVLHDDAESLCALPAFWTITNTGALEVARAGLEAASRDQEEKAKCKPAHQNVHVACTPLLVGAICTLGCS